MEETCKTKWIFGIHYLNYYHLYKQKPCVSIRSLHGDGVAERQNPTNWSKPLVGSGHGVLAQTLTGIPA